MRVEFESAGGEAVAESEVAAGVEFELPAALRPRRPRLTERLPLLFPAAVAVHRTRRRIAWATSGIDWASRRVAEDLPVRVKQHKSLLLRTLGKSEMWMQHNKVTNLRIAAERIDGLVLEPGQEFSFCRTVGKTTRRKGYLEGMILDQGEARSGVGGGICQLANLLHWMVLHTPLTVTERSEHGFDPFPDDGRVLPWGVGCAIYYNYVDLRFRNDTPATFQLRVSVGDQHLEGEIRSDRAPAHAYKVYAVDERFVRRSTPDGDDQWFRMNEIWRNVIDRQTGDHLRREMIKKNCALVKYEPPVGSEQTHRSAGLGGAEVVQ